MCNRALNPGVCLCFVPEVDDFFDVHLGDRVEADDAVVEGLVELEFFPLSTLHVHSVDRVVVRPKVFVGIVPFLLSFFFVQEADERKVNCVSFFVTVEDSWYQPSFYDCCLELRRRDMVELFRMVFFVDVLRQKVRLDWSS